MESSSPIRGRVILQTPHRQHLVEITLSRRGRRMALRCNFEALEFPSFVDGLDNFFFISHVEKPRRGSMNIFCALRPEDELSEVLATVMDIFEENVTD